jgi:hypothetical protein
MGHPRRSLEAGRTRRAPECAAAGRPRRIGCGQQTAGPAEGAGRLGLVPATESLPPTEESFEGAAHLGSGALPIHHARPALTDGGPGGIGWSQGGQLADIPARVGAERADIREESRPGESGPIGQEVVQSGTRDVRLDGDGVGQHGEAPVDGPPVGTRGRTDLGHGSDGQDHDDRHHHQGSDQSRRPPSYAASPSEPASFPDHPLDPIGRRPPDESRPPGREIPGFRARRHYTRLPCPSAPPLHLPRSTGALTFAIRDGSVGSKSSSGWELCWSSWWSWWPAPPSAM